MEYWAHSPNESKKPHALKDHLKAVADLAAEFASVWGGQDRARAAGLLHDLGKYGNLFQERLRGRERAIDHWTVGAWEALQRYKRAGVDPALAIQGHHLGLQRCEKQALTQMDPRAWGDEYRQGFRLSETDTSTLLGQFEADNLALPRLPYDEMSVLDALDAASMLDVRMLFSALVDADYLDTEAHFQGMADGPRYREPGPALEPQRALTVLSLYLRQVADTSQATDEVKQARADLLSACFAAAEGPPGLFTLTAPTGSGKTLAMLAFALRHADLHTLRRVVVVIPYLTIIEQTVAVYREAFSAWLSEEERRLYVLEDHSLAGTREKTSAEDECEDRRRLLAENWDAPIIVTTSVQMLESLFANRPGPCRKLHRLAKSVVLFDEVQTLPTRLAIPTLATLSHLATRYGASIVFSTATQPAFSHLDDAVRRHCTGGWRPREIVPDGLGLFTRLRRTTVHWPSEVGQRTSWSELAALLAEQSQALCIVNLKRHALTVFEELKRLAHESLYHLSTNMCPAHRQATLEDVRKRITDGQPCLLVSTQCVEAGVDVDFPVVFRAWGPLDAIAQAAGRCNRNGRLAEKGRVNVFIPDDADRLYPDSAYAQGAQVAQSLLIGLGSARLDINDPSLFETYYRTLYGVRGLGGDQRDDPLMDAIFRRDFVEVAAEYRLIRHDCINVLVPYSPTVFEDLAEQVERKGLTRQWVLSARPHTVSLFRPRENDLLWQLLEEVTVGRRREPSGDWFIYRGKEDDYSQETGLTAPSTMPLWTA